MLNSILAICRAVFLILGGHKQVALENIALRQQLGIFQRSPSEDSTIGPTVLGVSVESLERVEVGVGVCSARNRGRLAREAIQTILVPVVPAQESRSASNRRRHPKTGEDDGGSQCGLGSTAHPGELLKLGIEVSERTVSRLMPKRNTNPSQTWRTFLDNHVRDLVSIDFFTAPTARLRVLFVFIVLSHERRRVVHFNITEHPNAEWAAQQMVEAFPDDLAPRYLIRDRDGIYGKYFQHRVQGMGIQQVRTAPRSPWQNPYVERLIGSFRRECLDHVIVINDKHLRRILKSYLGYYHDSRSHLSLDKDAPATRQIQRNKSERIVPISQVGGLHHRYEQRAA